MPTKRNDRIHPINAWILFIGTWLLSWFKARDEAKQDRVREHFKRCDERAELRRQNYRRDKKAQVRAELNALKAEIEAYRRLHDPQMKDGAERHIDTT